MSELDGKSFIIVFITAKLENKNHFYFHSQIDESNLHDYLHRHEKQLLFGNDMSSEYFSTPTTRKKSEIYEAPINDISWTIFYAAFYAHFYSFTLYAELKLQRTGNLRRQNTSASKPEGNDRGNSREFIIIQQNDSFVRFFFHVKILEFICAIWMFITFASTLRSFWAS